jgi:Tol biopolymer transport system component
VRQDSSPIREGVFTPDGQAIVYRVDTPANNRDIHLIPLGEAQHPVPLLVGVNDDKQPRVSWDSKWLAYVSNESGREEVYVRALSGTGGRVPVSAGGGGEPLWSRDGKRLFYRTGSSLIAATIATSPALAVTSRAVLFEGPFETDVFHPNYDVVMDGERFIMVRPVEANRQLVLVVSWLSELRQRTGGVR